MNVDDATLEKERSKKCQTYAQPQEVSCKKLIGGGTYCPSSNTWVPPYCYADSPIGEFRVEYLTQSWKSRIERVLYSGDALYAISNSKLTQHIRSSPYTQTSQYIFEQNDQ
jgi:hypothetical protein